MVKPFDIAVIGGDMRQIYMIQSFLEKGYSVATYGLKHPLIDTHCSSLDALEEISKCNIAICPTPFTKDDTYITTMDPAQKIQISQLVPLLCPSQKFIAGMIPTNLRDHCQNNRIPYYDLMKSERVTLLNAIATAEGTLFEAMKASPINLHQSSCLILGFGRCAKVLAQKLYGIQSKVAIAARSESAAATASSFGYEAISLWSIGEHIHKYDFIFNTIPALVLTKDLLKKTKTDVVIIDIASAPGGVDFEAANQQDRLAKLCLGLPGKISPKTSGEILFQEIVDII